MERKQLLTHNYNLTKENERLLSNLTEEREKFRKKSDELQAVRQVELKVGFMGWIKLSSVRRPITKSCVVIRTLCSRSGEAAPAELAGYSQNALAIWSDSRRDCEERGANLLIINNKEEQEFVLKATAGYNYWIGLSKEGGEWKWVDGTTLTLSFWVNGSSYNHNCAAADASGWTDYQCNSIYRWICEKRIFEHQNKNLFSNFVTQ
ncbi:C-type lectin domain family 4 member M-like [Paramisgurnus dabryanus]|uniref:C-type lectin domain family 4 member M-like n=1 Tax=Paramisgurnus dabryanus TaxID=90735 RepID=UPI0031F405DB